MRRAPCISGLLLLAVLTAPPCMAGQYTLVYTNISVGGVARNFGYYVPPSYDPSTPAPLLFKFHGGFGDNSEASGGSAENGYYGWQSSAKKNGFIVLFPKIECCFGFNTWSLSKDSEDLDFVDALLDWAVDNYTIRKTHVFATGHSWGACFSYCVARWRADDFAAFSAHSGGPGGIPVPAGPDPSPILNAFLLHCKKDGLVPYAGSQELYDALVANGHNVYKDNKGADGIIEVDGWGPKFHRYLLAHNQAQWDFFMESSKARSRSR